MKFGGHTARMAVFFPSDDFRWYDTIDAANVEKEMQLLTSAAESSVKCRNMNGN